MIQDHPSTIFLLEQPSNKYHLELRTHQFIPNNSQILNLNLSISIPSNFSNQLKSKLHHLITTLLLNIVNNTSNQYFYQIYLQQLKTIYSVTAYQ